MSFTPSHRSIRILLAVAAAILLTLVYVHEKRATTQAQSAPEGDPDIIWRIGVADGSSDEFAAGSSPSLTYQIGKSLPEQDWRERQNAAEQQAPAYTITFDLEKLPAKTPLLAVDLYFLSIAPRAAELVVNGKRGIFRVRPEAAENLDERQANVINHSRCSLQAPIDLSLLKKGANELAISFLGEGGDVYYDSVSLRRSAKDQPKLTAVVEPTLFYRRQGDELTELTEVVLRHAQPVKKARLTMRLGPHAVSQDVEGGPHDFGELVAELAVPALAAAEPYDLEVVADGKKQSFQGSFQPAKRWRVFAGLKIHNDIGYTDLQPHVQELDGRNSDELPGIIRRFPFYKFNLETSWLVESYLESRKDSRTTPLLELAKRGQVGVNAFYLNLMTGICTGEELYRSLYFSKRLQRDYGIPMTFACLTDAPSHTVFVPSLLADAGVPGFANGSNQTRAPLLQNSHLNEDSPFYWEGVDGRRVLTWFARSYLHLHRLLGDDPSVDRLRRTLPQFLARYRRGDYPVDAVLLYGLYTDNADIRGGEAGIIEQWNQAFEFPKIIPATDGDYYQYLAKHFQDKLPVFRGDAGAYWEDGSGSTAAMTTLNRDSQRLLPVAEMFAALGTAFDRGLRYPLDEFHEAWKNLLFYDEHTWGAHNSVSQPDRRFVTDQWEVKRSFAMRAHWAAQDLLMRSLNRLVQNISIEGPTMFVFNPGVAERTDMVEIEIEPNRQVIDLASNRPVAFDVVMEKDGYRVLRFMAEKVPELGYKAYAVRRVDEPLPNPNELLSRRWEVDSRYYRLAIDRNSGAITSLYDKQLARELVDSQAPFGLNELVYVSGGENSRILRDLVMLKPPELETTGPSGAELVENVKTPFGHRLRVRARAKNVPSIETEITLYDNLKRVDIVNRLEKKAVRAKEAVYFAFPFRVSPPELSYQVQNTWVRPNVDQLPGACRDWFTTQNLVVARDAGATIAWATPDSPLITLTDINRGDWLKHLDVKNGHIFSYPMNNYWFTNYKASQGGSFTYRYSITSGSKITEAELARFDTDTRSPLVGYPFYDTGNVRLQAAERRMPLSQASFLRIDTSNAELTAFKEAEDGNGYILRIRETAGRDGMATLHSPVFRLQKASLCDGVEADTTALTVGGNSVEIPLKSRRFTTVRLMLENGT